MQVLAKKRSLNKKMIISVIGDSSLTSSRINKQTQTLITQLLKS